MKWNQISCLLALAVPSLMMGCTPQSSDSTTKFYSSDSLPVTVTYDTQFQIPLVEMPEAVDVDGQGQIALSTANQTKVDEVLKLHILHLYGVFSYQQKPVDFSIYSGTIEESYKELGTKVTKIEKDQEHLVVSYHYVDRGVFYSDLIENGQSTTLKFYMPKEPTTIYKKTIPDNPVLDPHSHEPINPCSDKHDNSELAFWYYWSPQREGCPASIMNELELVQAKFKVLPVTKVTYPQYDLLYQNPTPQISIIVGADEKITDPNDAGRLSYDNLRMQFEKLTLANGAPTFEKLPSVASVYENTAYHYKTNMFDAQMTIYFVNTDDETKWDDFAAERLAYSDIMIFSGHSYEGWYFDPERLFANGQNQMSGDRYQVLFFNACTTWSYYNSNFFELKKNLNQQAGNAANDPNGTKYLDILTNGIGAPFTVDSSNPNDTRKLPDFLLVTNLLGINGKGRPMAKLPSWQTIMDRITSAAGYDYTALTNVIGDEDNPHKLPQGVKVPKPSH